MSPLATGSQITSRDTRLGKYIAKAFGPTDRKGWAWRGLAA